MSLRPLSCHLGFCVHERHTTLGLKDGSTSLLSKACQLMVWKKGCKRILPTTPSLRVGSLSNNCKTVREGNNDVTTITTKLKTVGYWHCAIGLHLMHQFKCFHSLTLTLTLNYNHTLLSNWDWAHINSQVQTRSSRSLDSLLIQRG